MLAVTLFFTTNMHFLVITTLNDSYTLFEPGASFCATISDVQALMTRKPSLARFASASSFASPFLVFRLMSSV